MLSEGMGAASAFRHWRTGADGSVTAPRETEAGHGVYLACICRVLPWPAGEI